MITALPTLDMMAEVQYLAQVLEVAAVALRLQAQKLLAGMVVPGVVMP